MAVRQTMGAGKSVNARGVGGDGYCGSAMMSGFPAALLDVVDVERASGEELCRMAERMGIDLRRFVVDSDESW